MHGLFCGIEYKLEARLRIDFSTICTSDYFQHYIPLYAYCLRKLYPSMENRITIGITGAIDDLTKEACALLPYCTVHEKAKPSGNIIHIPVTGVVVTDCIEPDLKIQESTANTMRWLYFLEEPNDFLDQNHVEAVMITDIDLLLFDDNLIKWHQEQAAILGAPYYTHHGPWKKPERFPCGWKGELERIAGGFVWLEREWFVRTKSARAKYIELLRRGEIGHYRENDEVTLCNICKESGLPISTSKFFPPELRGIHMGDFKASMEHRHTNYVKMIGKLTIENCMKYCDMVANDETWKAIYEIVYRDPQIKLVFDNLHAHLEKRGIYLV